MTTFAETLAAIKSQARITSSDRDTQLGIAINEAYRDICGEDFFPFLRTATTQVLTAGTQDYALPSDFGQMSDESVRRYVTGTTQYTVMVAAQVPDAELWNSLESQSVPSAWMIVAGTSSLIRKLRVMPNFTATDLTISYTYYARISDVSGSSVLGSPAICDYVMWKVLAGDACWSRDVKMAPVNMAFYQQQMKSAQRRARQELLT